MPEDFTPDEGRDAFDDFLSRYLAGERGRAARSIDLSRYLSARTQETLQDAGRFALARGQHELDALHVLREIVRVDQVRDAIARLGVDPESIVRESEQRLPPAQMSPTSTPRS